MQISQYKVGSISRTLNLTGTSGTEGDSAEAASEAKMKVFQMTQESWVWIELYDLMTYAKPLLILLTNEQYYSVSHLIFKDQTSYIMKINLSLDFKELLKNFINYNQQRLTEGQQDDSVGEGA